MIAFYAGPLFADLLFYVLHTDAFKKPFFNSE